MQRPQDKVLQPLFNPAITCINLEEIFKCWYNQFSFNKCVHFRRNKANQWNSGMSHRKKYSSGEGRKYVLENDQSYSTLGT